MTLADRSAGAATASANAQKNPGTAHWAFQPLRKVDPPAVKNREWAKTPIDRFILKKLEDHGLAPAPVVDRRTLIRRGTFDLIGLPPTPEEVDAFLGDLKQRGLFDDTLVLWNGEFGRTPVAELPALSGRDHNHYGFSVWLAGGGVKGGTVYGATDEFGFQAVENPIHVHDLHATILHLLGLDHERLTYRYAGRDFRLTDVAGNVVKGIVA